MPGLISLIVGVPHCRIDNVSSRRRISITASTPG